MESMCTGDNLIYLELIDKYPQFKEDILVRLPGAGSLGDILPSNEQVRLQNYHMQEDKIGQPNEERVLGPLHEEEEEL